MPKILPDQEEHTITIGGDVEIKPLPEEHHPSFISLFRQSIDPTTSVAVGSQVLTNTFWRQILANGRLGVNTGESVFNVATRFAKKPSTAISGSPSRFLLQFVTQGVAATIDRSASRSGVENPITVPASFTAQFMTLFGMVLEPINLRTPIQDKVDAMGGSKINFRSRLPVMTVSVAPIILARNQFYARAVFGNKDKTLAERTMIAAIVAVPSNPLDNLVNITAYEAAIAKDGTPLKVIFHNVWKSFAGTPTELPYDRLVHCIKKSLNGVSMRVAGVAGACVILSPEVTSKLAEGFDEYSQSFAVMWNKFQEKLSEHGGVDSKSMPEEKPPSPTIVSADAKKVESEQQKNSRQ